MREEIYEQYVLFCAASRFSGGRTALCPEMSVAPAARQRSTTSLRLLSFGGWDQYSFDLVMSISA